MEQIRALPNLPLPSHSSALLERALIELERNNYDPVIAVERMSQLTAADFPDLVEWTSEEISAFEEAVKVHGHDLYEVAKSVPSKRYPEVVRFFYRWKKTDRYEPVYSEWTKVYKPTKKFKKMDGRSTVIAVDDDGDKLVSYYDDGDREGDIDPTVVHVNTDVKATFSCNNCKTVDSTTWRRVPDDIDRKRKEFEEVLCNTCGLYWLKYNIMRTQPPRSAGASTRVKYKRKEPAEADPSRPSKRRNKEIVSFRFA